MLKHSVQPMNHEEIARIKRMLRPNWIQRMLRHKEDENNTEFQDRSVKVYQASVEQCFIPDDFNEELPLYLLNVGESILLLFGQWLYDPHVSVVHPDTFEIWNCEREFFSAFTVKCCAETGIVLEFLVESDAFVQAKRITSDLNFTGLRECQVISSRGDIVQDLNSAGLLKAE